MPEANVSSNIQRMHQIPRYRQWKDEEDGKVFKCKYEILYENTCIVYLRSRR